MKAQAGILESDDARPPRQARRVYRGAGRGARRGGVDRIATRAPDRPRRRQPTASSRRNLQRVAAVPRGHRFAASARDRDRGPALGAGRHDRLHRARPEWSTGYPILILCSARPELLRRRSAVGRRDAQLGDRLAHAAERRRHPNAAREHHAADTASRRLRADRRAGRGNPCSPRSSSGCCRTDPRGTAVGSRRCAAVGSSPRAWRR